MITFECPLQWPASLKRTSNPTWARFGEHSIRAAGDQLSDELRKLGGKNIVISTNLQTRSRGEGFLANQKCDDKGIAVYFDLKGAQKVMACDKWNKVEHNIWALAKAIEAVRGLERWGGSQLLDGMFTGFQALPDYSAQNSRLYFWDETSKDALREKYVKYCKELHPDVGGSQNDFVIMQKQYEAKLKEVKE